MNDQNSEKLIKSKERCRKYGEVFTPEWVVKKMCDELPEGAFELNKTFLEPACGTGNFLVEIFRRKLEHCNTASEGIQALESIYGVDILPDNVAESRKRLLAMYKDKFKCGLRSSFVNVARLILRKNIIQADFLKIADKIKFADNWNSVVDGENQQK